MKKYELVYIIDPEMENETSKITEKVRSFVTKRGGEILKEDILGKKKLAYKIKKHDFAIYTILTFQVEPKNVMQIDKDLRLQEEIIRHLIVIYEEYVKIENKKPEKAMKVKEEKKEKEEEKPKIKKEKKEDKEAEKERLKKMDEKLEEIIGKE